MAALKAEKLTKKFGSFLALSDLSFSVAENHVVGFLGPNGAGKTTTLRMLVGLSRPTEGKIEVAGKPVIFGSSTNNQSVGYLPELPSFYAWMTGDEYLSFTADIFKLPKEVQKKKIDTLLDLVDLKEARTKRIGTYSGGMKQRLGIAQALINDPKVIILDEPVSALDPLGRKEVLDVIEKLKKDHTILFSTHILSDVDRICDDIIILNKGKLVVSKPLAELKAEFAAPILEVEFTADAKPLSAGLRSLPWVKKFEQSGNLLKIWINGEDVVKNNIALSYFSKQKIGILSFGLRVPETEDLFIELLGRSK
jgi:ABC-2 type transport system ATP-binding protein